MKPFRVTDTDPQNPGPKPPRRSVDPVADAANLILDAAESCGPVAPLVREAVRRQLAARSLILANAKTWVRRVEGDREVAAYRRQGVAIPSQLRQGIERAVRAQLADESAEQAGKIADGVATSMRALGAAIERAERQITGSLVMDPSSDLTRLARIGLLREECRARSMVVNLQALLAYLSAGDDEAADVFAAACEPHALGVQANSAATLVKHRAMPRAGDADAEWRAATDFLATLAARRKAKIPEYIEAGKNVYARLCELMVSTCGVDVWLLDPTRYRNGVPTDLGAFADPLAIDPAWPVRYLPPKAEGTRGRWDPLSSAKVQR
jgi:hypothetical protein